MANFASVKIRERKKIAPPSLHSILHNSRIGKEATYLLPQEYRHENFHSKKISNANGTWDRWVEEIEQRYQAAHNRKLRSDAVRIEEGLIVLSDEQVRNSEPAEIWEKMQEFARWFEKRHNTEILSLDWHRDEGKVIDGKVSYNEHCHFFFADVGMDGNKVRSNWKRSGEELREMQDKIAELFEPLGFSRGISGQRKEYRRPREQRAKRAAEEKEGLTAKLKDVNEENRRLRAQLREAGAQREQYAQLEQTIRVMREEAREKDLTISDLQTRIGILEKELTEQDSLIAKVEELAEVVGAEVTEEPRATREEIIDATKFLVHSNLKIDAEWKGNSSLKSLNEMTQYIKFCDDNLERENLNEGDLLAIYDSYLVHQDERPKTRTNVELLSRKGAFSRFYSAMKGKSRVGKAIELISSIMDKITGKLSTPSPVVPTKKAQQNQPQSRRLKP